MIKRSLISLKCPVCLNMRLVRKDGAGILCRSCRAKETSRHNAGKFENLDGRRYGKLLVVSLAYNIRGRYWWKCICDCGNNAIILGTRLKSLKTKSCGCIARSKKGLSRSPTYRSWKSMLQRCYDTKVAHYERYGARGISVCHRWRASFFNFLEDMGERPDGLTLDRIDSNGNYEIKNCRWAEINLQARNRRNNHIIKAFGRSQTLTGWAEEFNIKSSTLLRRISLGWNIEEALVQQVKCRIKFKGRK